MKDFYGLFAVYSDERGGGHVKSYVCALPELGRVLHEMYSENATDIYIGGSGSDEFLVSQQLVVALAEDTALRRSYGSSTTRTAGSVRSVFLEYEDAASVDEYMVIGEDLDEIVCYTMRAILCGATNMTTVYQGSSVDEGVAEVTRYILKAHNFLNDGEVHSDVG